MDLYDNEKEVLIDLFLSYALKQPQSHSRKVKRLFMRNRRIWIAEKDFIKRYQPKKVLQDLLAKKVIVAHPIFGYQFFIREAYVEKIYLLADHGDISLLTQLVGLWVEPVESS